MKITFEVPYQDDLMIDIKAILSNNNVEVNTDIAKVTVIIEG